MLKISKIKYVLIGFFIVITGYFYISLHQPFKIKLHAASSVGSSSNSLNIRPQSSEEFNLQGLNSDYTLEINYKDPFNSVLNKLLQDKLISINNYYALKLYAKFTRKDLNIKAGEYLLNNKTTGVTLLNKLVNGQVELYKFTIIEGLRLEQTLASISKHPKLLHTLTQDSGCQQILLAISRGSPVTNLSCCEGLFLPDTYVFTKNTPDIIILQKAYDAMQARLSYLWENSSNKGVLKSSYEALIMASIIEKETRLIQEMKRVSGVYHRRLQIGIPLQADPTVIYGLKIYNRSLTRKDLKIPSEYNTYLNKELPPSPIATPSVAAIFAALNPIQEDYLYFVADGSGGHIFSRSLLEHNRAVAAIKAKASVKTVNQDMGSNIN